MVNFKASLAAFVITISVPVVFAAARPCSGTLEKLDQAGKTGTIYHKHAHRISATTAQVWYNWFVTDPLPGFDNKLTGDFVYLDPLIEEIGNIKTPTTAVTLFIENLTPVARSIQIALHEKSTDEYPSYQYTLTAEAGKTRQECFLMDKSFESKAISFQGF